MADALIVGAGPSGLFMAAELVRHGLSVRVIEKESERSIYSKALAIQPRTLEIFAHLGIIDRFLAEGHPVRAMNPVAPSGPLARLSFEQLDTAYPFILSLEQSKTERILEEYLSSLGVHVERNVELRAFDQTPWIIGCDGSHSIVRKLLGLSFEGRAFPSTFSLADVRIEWSRSHDEAYGFLGPKGLLGVIPLPEPGRYRLVFQLPRVVGAESPPPTLKEVQQLLLEAKITDPIWLTNFHIHTRMVSSYRKGNVFLVGDAAHIHSPAGGQGMNSGIQDAFNLAWKLALVHQGRARPGLLDTYNLERQSFGRALLKNTELATRIATLRNPIAMGLRNGIFRFLLSFKSVRKKLARGISQLAIQYPSSSIVTESGFFHGGPRAGSRALNVSVDGKTDLFSLWKKTTKHQILIFTDAEIPQKYLQFKSALFLIRGVSNRAHAAYGVRQDAVYIIRPDLVVGHRSSPPDLKKVADYLELV